MVSRSRNKDPEDFNSISIIIIILSIIYMIYKIIVAYWMWLLLIIIIGIIGWIIYKKNNNTIQEIKTPEPIKPFGLGNKTYNIYQENKTSNNFINDNDLIYKNFKENEDHKTGVKFEIYVSKLFSRKYFDIEDWTKDSSKSLNRRVKSDSNPDIKFSYIKTKELFSIECKFRSKPFNNSINWAKDYQIQNYRNYESKNKIPTFIVIGLGGRPDNPQRMFCLPLRDAKYTNLFMSFLENYERPPDRMFFWKNRNLK